MKKLIVTSLTMLALMSVAAPAGADVVVGPSVSFWATPAIIIGCLSISIIAVIVIGVILIRHNHKKKSGYSR